MRQKLIRGEGATNAQLVGVEDATLAYCDTHDGVPANGVDLHHGCLHFNDRGIRILSTRHTTSRLSVGLPSDRELL